MIILLSTLLACGEKEDTASEPAIEPSTEPSSEDTATDILIDCIELSVDQCGERSDCAIITGREITVDQDNTCFTVSDTTIELGCHSADIGCTEAEEYAMDPAVGECTWFSNGCLPTGWESCSMEMEQCP